MLDELKRLWLIEAVKYNVLPLDDRRIERFNSDLAGRPVLVHGNSQILYGGIGPPQRELRHQPQDKSYSVTAEIVVPDGGGHGVLVAQGGAFAGWALYLNNGNIDGESAGDGKIAATVPMIYSGDETCDVGYDSGTPVSEDYTSANSQFNGTVKWVQLDAGLGDRESFAAATDISQRANSVGPRKAERWQMPH